ncbi:MAG: MFS transporter [Azospirillaceae bacterium]|nr:MFS transporter [Azospirillaceae bacterium]
MSQKTRTVGAGTLVSIVTSVAFTFIVYFLIGISLSTLPGYVHFTLGYSSIVAGSVVSTQYLATLLTRAQTGQLADRIGARKTVRWGLCACILSGVLMTMAAWLEATPALCLTALVLARLLLGMGESGVSTGSTLWGIGQVGVANTARVISWNGIATYGALAVGAPCGVLLQQQGGLLPIAAVALAFPVVGLIGSLFKSDSPIIRGERLPIRHVIRRVLPYGLGLGLGSIGFGTIASFITLYYASRHWPHAAFTLTSFSVAFVAARFLFTTQIDRRGGLRVAMASLATECLGLGLLWWAPHPWGALVGAALSGLGFSLVFPALGVEAMNRVPPASRGAALGLFSVFLDLSLGLTGPITGVIIHARGYPAAFLFAAAAAALAGLIATVLLIRSRPLRNTAAAPA